MRIVILVLCLCIPVLACADSVVVQLPSLTGDYDSGFIPPDDYPRMRTTSFTIPAAITSIERIQVVMSGTKQSDAWEICEFDIGGGETAIDTLPVPPQMRLVLTAPSLNGGCFFGAVTFTTPTVEDGTDWVHDCLVAGPLDLDLLLETTVEAELESNFQPRCDPYVDARTELNSIYLIVEGQTVATERTPWGDVKALFR